MKWLRDGEMSPAPKIHIVSEAGSSALLDGDRGIGMVIGHRAMELAIRKSQGIRRRHGRGAQQPPLRHVRILCDASAYRMT